MGSRGGWPRGANTATTDFAASTVTVQVAVVPEQAPSQRLKSESLPATALGVPAVPPSKVALRAEPQSIPTGELVTVPAPPPAFVTLTAYLATTLTAFTVETLLSLVPSLALYVKESVPRKPGFGVYVTASPVTGDRCPCTGPATIEYVSASPSTSLPLSLTSVGVSPTTRTEAAATSGGVFATMIGAEVAGSPAIWPSNGVTLTEIASPLSPVPGCDRSSVGSVAPGIGSPFL